MAAWALATLLREFDVTLLSWMPPDLDATNRAFGTSLRSGDFAAAHVPAWQRRALAAAPTPLALLTSNLLMRAARRLDQRRPFDLIVGTMNELFVGRPAIQYVHYPWAAEPRPRPDLRWYHLPGLLRLYRRGAARVSGYRPEQVARNLTLVNSDWTGERFREWYGAPATTLAPPVPGEFPEVPWSERHDRLVCVGRLSPEKELPKILRIFDALRRRGHGLELLFVGHPDHRPTVRQVEAAARTSDGTIRVAYDLSRDELVHTLARSRYGIHGMRDEHFGIAAAELQRAGCIPFVPDSGGVAEIVDHDPHLTYATEADAVAQIDRVLREPGLRDRLRAQVTDRRERYSVKRFQDDFSRLVHGFAPADPLEPDESEAGPAAPGRPPRP